MRTVSASLLAKARADDGHEASLLVEIDTGSGLLTFSEHDLVGGTDPRIMEIGSLNASVSESGATVGSVNVKLSDEDNYLLDLMCSTRLEGRHARVLMIFDQIITDSIELFVGRVGSPLVWEEENRTLSFDIVALYESGDKEVPFAPDESDDLQEFAWNKPWPRLYGTPVDVPAVLVVDAPKGKLTRELRPLDSSFEIEVADNIEFELGVDIEVDVGNERISGRFSLVRDDPTTILRFDIQSRNRSKGIIYSLDRATLTSIEETPEEYTGKTWALDPRYAAWDAGGKILAGQWLLLLDTSDLLESGSVNAISFVADHLYGIVSLPSFVGNKNYILYQQGDATRGQFPWIVPSGLYFISIGARADIRGVLDVNDTLWPAGTEVRLVQDVKYVVSDVPVERVLQVRAWREVKIDERGGKRRELVVVPASFYTVELDDEIAGRTCTTLTFEQPLSTRGAGWDDTVYVTAEASVGPNIADIIADLITEAGLTVDPSSFAAVETACNKYPMNFAILDRKDALVLANDIAFQGRCGLVVLGSVAYLKYLSLAPTSVSFTYNDDTALDGALQLTSTELTEVANDLWVTWHRRGSQEDPEKLHYTDDASVAAFGRKKKDLEIYAYRHKRLVQKTAQFWFNRWSRVWRKMRIVGDLDAIDQTVYDDVKSTLSELVTNGVIESLEHNSDEDQIAALLWTPVEVGSCDPSDFAYLDDGADTRPADLDIEEGDDVAEVIEVSPLDFSLNEPETHVGEALNAEVPAGPIGGVFNAKLYKGNAASGDVIETSVKVQNLCGTAVKAGDIVVVHKSADGTFYAVKSGGDTTNVTGGGTLFGILQVEENGDPTGFDDSVDPNDTRWNTALTVDEESQYQAWRLTYDVEVADEVDYDYRGAFKVGITPEPTTLHWPDTYKKPNHATFSNESKYAYLMPHKAGYWNGETYVSPDTNKDHYFSASLFSVSAAFSTSQGSRIGRRIGTGAVYDSQVLPVYLGSDGVAWILPLDSPFAMAKVRSDSADKSAIPCRLYLTSDFAGDGNEDISVILPALQTTAKVSAGTWVVVMKLKNAWVGYIPLIRPRVPA